MLTLHQFRALALAEGASSHDDQFRVMTLFLHDTGCLLWFADHETLHDRVLVHVPWLADHVARLVMMTCSKPATSASLCALPSAVCV